MVENMEQGENKYKKFWALEGMPLELVKRVEDLRMRGTCRGTSGTDLGTEGGAGSAGASLLHRPGGPELLALPPMAARQRAGAPQLHPRNRPRSCHVCGTSSCAEGHMTRTEPLPNPCHIGIASLLEVTWLLYSPSPQPLRYCVLRDVRGQIPFAHRISCRLASPQLLATPCGSPSFFGIAPS